MISYRHSMSCFLPSQVQARIIYLKNDWSHGVTYVFASNWYDVSIYYAISTRTENRCQIFRLDYTQADSIDYRYRPSTNNLSECYNDDHYV